MSKAVCPMCGAAIEAEFEELRVHDRIQCEECEAVIELLSLDPMRLEWVEEDEDDDFDLDEDDEDDDLF